MFKYLPEKIRLVDVFWLYKQFYRCIIVNHVQCAHLFSQFKDLGCIAEKREDEVVWNN